jgi:hypothetical protein
MPESGFRPSSRLGRLLRYGERTRGRVGSTTRRTNEEIQ